jgi:hypothetical protein
MAVYDVKPAREVFAVEEFMGHSPAHVVHFLYQVRVEGERAAMIVDAMNVFIRFLSRTYASEDMHLMTHPLLSSSQFCDDMRNATDSY